VSRLNGRRVLVVEDEYFIAQDLRSALEEAGAQVVGPVGEPRAALDILVRESVDFAVLDINLMGKADFTVADQLSRTKIPFIFATGYETGMIPHRFRKIAVWRKPFDATTIATALSGLAE